MALMPKNLSMEPEQQEQLQAKRRLSAARPTLRHCDTATLATWTSRIITNIPPFIDPFELLNSRSGIPSL